MLSTRLLLRQPQDEIDQVLDLSALQALAETRHRAPALADAQVDLAAAAGAGAEHPRRGEVQARIEADRAAVAPAVRALTAGAAPPGGLDGSGPSLRAARRRPRQRHRRPPPPRPLHRRPRPPP